MSTNQASPRRAGWDGSQVDLSGVPVTTDAPVLVTGANGFVASWIVTALLAAGVEVHAAVRDPENRRKVGHLLDAAASSPGTLRLFKADLLRDGSYDEAMDGCRIVLHTASPFVRNVEDPQRDLVDPALRGTRNVLHGVERTESVRRVVLTSSIAAMYTDATETGPEPGLDESVWNTTASLEYEPYNYSKTVAERAAWDLAQAQSRWQLVVINPALVFGPSLNGSPTSESFTIMKQLGGGQLRFGAPRLELAVVDVREVARAHIAAAFVPGAHGRNVVCAGSTDLLTMGRMLLPEFADDWPLPRWGLPKAMFRLVAPLVGVTRRYADGNIGHPARFDAAKSRSELGMVYRPIRESITDMFGEMAERGDFGKRGTVSQEARAR